MADEETSGVNNVLKLKLSFRELEETAFSLGQLKAISCDCTVGDDSRFESQESADGKGSVNAREEGGRGLLYIKPTNKRGSTKDRTRRSRSSEKGSGENKSEVKTESKGTVVEYKNQSTGSRQRISGEDRDKKELLVDNQVHSKSIVDQPSRNLKVELRQLLTEWDRLDCRKVERNLSRWNGDVADLGSTLKLR